MAIMIPPLVHIGTQSQGEREVFRRLRDDPNTKQWIVLHSLDISSHIKNVSGEADFIVIVPTKGVLCLEIKGCGAIRRTQGQWYYGVDQKPDHRGPFKQASEAMHSIRKHVSKISPTLSYTVFWSVVVFPFIDFSIKSDEWHPWQVIDSQALRSKSVSQLLLSVLDNARTLLSQRKVAWFNPISKIPNNEQCMELANILRPSFEYFESPGSRSERLQKELKQYTIEQYEALDSMQENNRVAFIGPAGTGKTLLAIEAARRGVASRRRVLFLCFNRFLGDWLKEQTSELRPNLVCSTLHSLMLSILNKNQIDDNIKPEFWEKELPTLALRKILANTTEDNLFDEVIIDEAQDILTDQYLDFIDAILKGGWASGYWRLFGDFEKQTIYIKSKSPQEVLLRRCANVPTFTLRCNCRNSPRVVELVHLLGGLKPPYRKILRSDDGIEPTVLYHQEQDDERNILVSSLENILSSGYKWEDIVILSPKNDKECLAAKINSLPWGAMLRPFSEVNNDHISYTTIQAFKGMEAPVIIVTDIDHVQGESSSSLFYIAITRALQRLFIIANSSIKKELMGILLKIRSGNDT
jgi:hypothetical protein